MKTHAELSRFVGANLRSTRVAIGISQRALSAKTDAPSRTEIVHIEAGRRLPTLMTLYQLASALNVAPATLVPDPRRKPRQ